jgi:GH25 family lysozyme M1 (1,4-beta-N-acetylmuramidase)
MEAWKSEVWGVDVSQHQGTIDVAALENGSCSFVLVKATEGRGFTDPCFAATWSALEPVNVYRGAYHFARIDTNATEPGDARLEAEHFARAVGFVNGPWDLPPWLDCEFYGSLEDETKNIEWIARWIDTVERLLGRSPGIYTGCSAWSSRWANTGRFAHLPLWQADHASPAGKPEAMRVPNWRPSIHQFTSQAVVDGIDANVDANVIATYPYVDGLLQRRSMQLAVLDNLVGKRLIRPSPKSTMPEVDFGQLDPSQRNETVAVVQGLLLARGLSSSGLVDATGRPDGKPGPRTRAALEDYRQREGLGSGTRVDGATWHRLLAVETP